jgi:hypothetical protein
MFLESIKHEKTRQILWFIILWCGGLAAVSLLGLLIKCLMFIAG